MKKINLSNFKINQNYVLIKPDPDYEFIEVKPESGFEINNEPVKIWIGYTSETHAKHFSITGKIISLPNKLTFNKKRIANFKKGKDNSINRSISDQIVVAQLMDSSQQIDVDIEVEVGDKVWFDYLCQINAVVHKLLIDTEEHGMCFLAKYEDLYCYEREGELELINGWVWIQRIERNTKSESGLDLQFDDKNKHETNKAIIIKSAKAVRQYMDSDSEDQINFNGGEQVIYNGKMGHSAEYALHRKLTEGEVYSIRRKHIYAVI